MTRLVDKILKLGGYAKVAALATIMGAAPALGATVTQTVSTSGVSGQYMFDFTALLAAEALNGNGVDFTGGTISFAGESAANATPDELTASFIVGPFTLNLFEAGDRVNDIATVTYGATVLTDDTRGSAGQHVGFSLSVRAKCDRCLRKLRVCVRCWQPDIRGSVGFV